MSFVDLFCWKLWIIELEGLFYIYLLFNSSFGKIGLFSHFSSFSAKEIHKTHKITSLEDDMRKILSQKFWSHGTPLGYLGPVSQKALNVWSSQFQILVIWGPYEPPVLVACQAQAENPKSAGALCDTPIVKTQETEGKKKKSTSRNGFCQLVLLFGVFVLALACHPVCRNLEIL